MNSRPRLCIDCDAEVTRRPGQSNWSWRTAVRCPRCAQSFRVATLARRMARTLREYPAPVSASSAAVTVSRQFNLYYSAGDHDEFVRKFEARELLFARETREYQPTFYGGPGPFSPEGMRERGFGGGMR